MKAIEKCIAGEPSWILRGKDVELAITQRGGQMAPVTFYHNTKNPVLPYYISPWQGEGRKIADPVLVPLRGDFFCAPFGANTEPLNGEKHPCHGESASAKWKFVGMEKADKVSTLTLSMQTKIRKGKVTKTISLVDGQNVVYSRHVLEGYTGSMPMGHHATLQPRNVAGSLRVTTSPFALGMTTPGEFSEPATGSYQSFAVGEKFTDLRKVPLLFKDNPTADLTALPARAGHTDLLAMYKKPSKEPAWTAAVDAEAGYLWFSLKDAAVLPATLFWVANRGRHMSPWDGKELCLGLEDVCAYFAMGLEKSVKSNPVKKAGFATAVTLSPKTPTVINYIQGVVRVPKNFGPVKAVRFEKDRVTFVAENKKTVSAAVNWDYLQTGEL